MTTTTRTWWKDGTVYQVYPASFSDSNGDGLGDIPGITSKLDYLKDLGIDIIWVSPMFDSPQIDMGYDVRNYEEVYAPFGTVADMEHLIQEAHSRSMRILLDLVINHTSDEHAWFKESRSSKDNPNRDWYIWRPARYDEQGNRLPPNNWRSFFSEPAWQWDEHTQEYYLHLFAKEQPDLNWENDDTRNAIYDSAMRFWLDKGVDGFRVDTVNMYSKGLKLPDVPVVDPKSFYQPAHSAICNGPRMHEFLREMNTKVLNHYDTMTVGELPYTPDPSHVLRYVGSNDKQINMCFQFDLCDLGLGSAHKFKMQPWSIDDIKRILSKWQTFHQNTDGWTTTFLENHDNGRSISRYCSDSPEHWSRSAKLLSILTTTLTGTLFIYQGQEIGMINAPRSWPISEYKDIESNNFYNLISQQPESNHQALEKAMSAIQIIARDHARLPMQWTPDTANGGFSPSGCKKEPWMRTNETQLSEINVETQQASSSSVLNFWKSMLRLRKDNLDLLCHGLFKVYNSNGLPYDTSTPKSEVMTNGTHNKEGKEEGDKTLIFSKTNPSTKQQALVTLNFSSSPSKWVWPQELRRGEGEWKMAVNNYDTESGVGKGERKDKEGEEGGERMLSAWEGRVYMLKPPTSA